jgi:hypothetical protein
MNNVRYIILLNVKDLGEIDKAQMGLKYRCFDPIANELNRNI